MGYQADVGRSTRLAGRKLRAGIFHGLFLAATLLGIVALFILLGVIIAEGGGALFRDFPNFFTSAPSRFPEMSGIRVALLGTIWMMAFTALFSIPVGMGAAVYLEEYAPRHWLTRLIQINISNLAGVPSIVYGLLGLALFVRALALDRSILAAALTMSLLVMPIIIITTQEAIRSVPQSLRQASYALGATRWQTIWHVVLPQALPGILTGTILALSRAIWGDGPSPDGWRPQLPDLQPLHSPGSFPGVTHSDLQLDHQAPVGVSRNRRRRYNCIAGGAAGHERRRRVSAQPVPAEVRGLKLKLQWNLHGWLWRLCRIHLGVGLGFPSHRRKPVSSPGHGFRLPPE